MVLYLLDLRSRKNEPQDAAPEEDVEGECAPNAKEARDAAMALIKNLKPAVAAIPNEAQRKRAADSLAILIKGSM